MPPTGNVTLSGAGATFPALLYQVWIEKFNEAYSNVTINYQAIGSGGGIKAITQQTVDFGASDAAMKDEEIAALPAGTKMLHIPTALGAVVVIFNVKGKDGTAIKKLNLDGDTIAGHLPRQDHQVERPRDRGAQPGHRRQPAGHGRS